MEAKECTVCCSNKTAIQCDICSCASCKHCCYFIDEDVFEFVSLLPEKLQNKAFCPNCYNENISEEMEYLKETMQKARDVDVYLKDQGTETRRIRRIQKPIHIKECADREETLMRLAFLAAQKGFDTIIGVDIQAKKVGKGTYKKMIWSGTAVPVDPKIRK